MQVDDRAIILQGFPYSETSKILKLLCEEHGVRTVIAKGALRPKGRFGGVLEPFTEGRARFRIRQGSEMHTLAGFDLMRSRQAIGRNLMAFAGASLICELALRFGTTESDPELFTRIATLLDALAEADEEVAAGTALGGVWQLISQLGYEPRLDACVGCGREIGAGEPCRFDVDAGGVACRECRPRGRLVSATSRQDLAMLCAGGEGDSAGREWGFHRALLRAFVGVHLSQEYPLRSLGLFIDLLPRSSSP